MTSNAVSREQCPQCLDTGRDNLVQYDDGHSYCYSCGYTTNELSGNSGLLDSVGMFVPLSKRKISVDVCQRYGVYQTTYANTPVLVFPFYKNGVLAAQKVKTPDKKIWWLGDKDVDMFGSQFANKEHKRIVITEGEEDCLAVAQTIGPTLDVTTLTNGAQSAVKFAKTHYKKLIKYEQIITCFDNDEEGQKATAEFARCFPVGQVACARIPLKDACEMLKEGKTEDLKWAVLRAAPEKPDGILCVGDITHEYFNETFPIGVDIGFPSLNAYLGGLRKGELTMVCAGTGIGKSTWISNIIYDFILNKEQKIVDIKLEETQRKTIYNYLAMYNDVCPRKFCEDTSVISDEKKTNFIQAFKNLWVHNHFGSLDSSDLLHTLDYYATILKVDYIFLDHVSIAISGLESSREGERKDIDKLLTKIRELIDRTGVGVICVSHLKNPPNNQPQWEDGRSVKRLDLRGSGSLAQLADNIIAIEGMLTNPSVKDLRQIKLIKTRYGNAQEVYCDEFKYNINNGKVTVV